MLTTPSEETSVAYEDFLSTLIHCLATLCTHQTLELK